MELFYNSLRDGRSIDESDIQTFAIEAWARNGLDVCSQRDPEKFKEFGDLAGAVLMLRDYYESKYLTDRQIWRVVSVEEGFGLNREVFLGEGRNSVVYWTGRPDLTVIENDRLVPVDHKTVSRIDGRTASLYKPSSQFPGYVFSCEAIARQLGLNLRVDRCVVNICSRSRPADKKRPRFIRAYPNFSREELSEWRRDVINKCDRIAHCLRTNEWTWSETSCHNMYMRDCEFVKLDSSTPAARDVVLAAEFQTGSPWVPYEVSVN